MRVQTDTGKSILLLVFVYYQLAFQKNAGKPQNERREKIKRIITLIMIFAVLCALCSCGTKGPSGTSDYAWRQVPWREEQNIDKVRTFFEKAGFYFCAPGR